MSDAFASTQWPPTPISSEVKHLLSRFLEIVDLEDEKAGQLLADEVFTSDGELVASTGSFHGADVLFLEIARSRENAWKVVDYRHHVIDKVFAGNKDGTDLILVGRLETRTKDSSNTTITEFAAKALVDTSKPSGPRLKLWAAYIGNSNAL
ncbi:hypothetical protein H2200_007643 [Cladophialophora chaetospira]|uniref:SnoaL-like domain-containing protein n=1 Tax=Cladophialophora chaetospira TaxID=386627 RepID=A0AA38X655_9EURO|nr:hypothetical protein H2200_007643 [Cladophialophora chaetospira]